MAVDRVAVIAFAKAVLTGAFAAAVPFLLLTVPLGLMLLFDFGDPMGGLNGLLIAAAPLIVTLPIVLGASILIGLPLTYLLRRSGREQGHHYVAAGAFFGGALPSALSLMAGEAASVASLYLALPGALGGALTGWSWGRHRDTLIAARNSEDADLDPTL
ncbi:hypothetical protein [Novosphingobium sp.]|uniref:hypothetical protein n=1 Tax=Novosphingobium sp. TaxID=1874826 RepID=UPI002736133E|nr:hypothetical protein [Novosphingobium sp.]MDP3905711.1 hypothetical protein [Novosphingobium sp.]